MQVSWPLGSALTAAYFAGEDRATRFYAGPFDRIDTFRTVAEGVDRRFSGDERAALLPAFRGRAAADTDRLRSFVEDGGYVVTTGQQAGLLTGPLFTLYKAYTAVSLARRLESRVGRPVLPVFWIASEDHDWDEASHTFLLSAKNELVRMDAEAAEPPGNRSVFQVPLTGADSAVETVSDVCIPNDFRESCLDLIREAYPAGASLADGFEVLLDRLFGESGLLIVRAEDPTLKSLTAKVLRDSVEQGAEQGTLLAKRSQELTEAGFHDQVAIIEGGLQVFREGPKGRTRLYESADGIRVGKEGPAEPLGDVLASMEEEPSQFSPNALLRPVAEAAAFPVLAYVAGPGEAAYYAQNSALYEGLGVTMPVIYPRASIRLIEHKVRKVLAKYDMEAQELAEPVHELVTRRAKDEVPEGVRSALGEIRAVLGSGAAELLEAAREIDPTLKGPIGQARNQSLHVFKRAEKKILQAIKRKNAIVEEQLTKARMSLFPGGTPQERVVNVFQFLCRYGPEVLEHIAQEIDDAVAEPS